jgi:hypothetical protein
MENYIVYLAHTGPGYIYECCYSLLKYLSVYNLKAPVNTSIVVYTDQPEKFENFIPYFANFKIEEVSTGKIKEWQGDVQYVHRAKPKMIQDFFTKYKGNLLFFDTDTYITKPIEYLWQGIENNNVYMHQSEGVIDKRKNKEFRKWDDFLKTAKINFGNKSFQYNPNFEIWNSGVIGINASYANKFEEIVTMIDSVHKQFPKHITEQLACSYLFEENNIQPTKDNIVHYWDLKEFKKLLTVFFTKNAEESIPNLVKMVHHIDAHQIMQEKMKYEDLSVAQKLMAALTGRTWNIQQHIKKL